VEKWRAASRPAVVLEAKYAGLQTAAFRHLSNVKSWIEQHALRKLHALPDQIFLKRHSGGAAVHEAEMACGQMKFIRNLLD
jgi:hypothetical protein